MGQLLENLRVTSPVLSARPCEHTLVMPSTCQDARGVPAYDVSETVQDEEEGAKEGEEEVWGRVEATDLLSVRFLDLIISSSGVDADEVAVGWI